MLMEAMVAVISLSCVMILATNSSVLQGTPKPNLIYGLGIGSFLGGVRHPRGTGGVVRADGVYDVCLRHARRLHAAWPVHHPGVNRLARRRGKWLGTVLTAGVPLFFLLQDTVDADGQPLPPVWRTFWSLFGASNQLLAALTLLGVTVWLWRTRRARWVWIVTGIPTVWMYTMSTWALVAMTWPKFRTSEGQLNLPADPVAWAGVVLVVLAALMLVEAIRIILGSGTPPRAHEALAPQPAG